MVGIMFEITFIGKLSYKSSSASWFYSCSDGPIEYLVSYFVIFFFNFGFQSFSSFYSLKLCCRVLCLYWQSDHFHSNSVMIVSPIMLIDFNFNSELQLSNCSRKQAEWRGAGLL